MADTSNETVGLDISLVRESPVYGVWQHDWEDDTLLALYWTREEAERHVKAHNAVPEIARLRERDVALWERTRVLVEERAVMDNFIGLEVHRAHV